MVYVFRYVVDMLSLIALLFFFTFSNADNTDNVRLIVSKDILNERIFEGKDMTVLYSIYNFHPTLVTNCSHIFKLTRS